MGAICNQRWFGLQLEMIFVEPQSFAATAPSICQAAPRVDTGAGLAVDCTLPLLCPEALRDDHVPIDWKGVERLGPARLRLTRALANPNLVYP